MSETLFETVEAGDWLAKEHGMTDYAKVVDIEETFGDRVKIAVETRSLSAETDDKTFRKRLSEPEINSDKWELIEDPREGDQ